MEFRPGFFKVRIPDWVRTFKRITRTRTGPNNYIENTNIGHQTVSISSKNAITAWGIDKKLLYIFLIWSQVKSGPKRWLYLNASSHFLGKNNEFSPVKDLKSDSTRDRTLIWITRISCFKNYPDFFRTGPSPDSITSQVSMESCRNCFYKSLKYERKYKDISVCSINT